MEKLILLLLIFANTYGLTISSDILDGSSHPFTSHIGEGRYSSYLAMNLDFLSANELRLKVEDELNISLKNRGEAHITTVTPVEYFNILKEFISIEEIEEISKEYRIQESDIKITCLGRFTKDNMSTFYIVINSSNLLKIRKEIERRFVKRSKSNAFKASHFFPHITLGFTHRDLHESDGAIKDASSCFRELQTQIL